MPKPAGKPAARVSDLLAQSLGTPGLWALIPACFIAGTVYGFAGFGAALVFMPVAAIFLPLETAIASFNLAALASVVTVLPGALRDIDRKASALLIACALPAVVLGLEILRRADVTALRWGVVAVVSVTLIALVTGWRYRGTPGPGTRAGVAAATGLVGGATGLLGPVLILFQLAGQDSMRRTRATMLVFLTVTSALLLPLMALKGVLTASAIPLGFAMLLPYAAGTKLGQALFDPAREEGFRALAYLIIFAAILLGLPVWD